MRINNRESKGNVEGRYRFPAIHDSQFTIHHSPPSTPPLQHRDK